MNSRFAASRPARWSRAVGGAVTIATLALAAAGLSLLPWPRFLERVAPGSGWPMAAVLLAAGILVVRLTGAGRWLPEWDDPRSAVRFAAGVLGAQAGLHLAAALGY